LDAGRYGAIRASLAHSDGWRRDRIRFRLALLNGEARMLSKFRSHRPSHATVVAYLALFVALGGSSYAALKVTGRNVPKDALTGADIKNLTGKDVRNNSLTGADVKNLGSGDVANGRLLAEDFASGQLPRGETGATGAPGAALAFAHVDADGTLDAANSKNVTVVSHSDNGIYCLDVVAGQAPRNVVASTDANGSAETDHVTASLVPATVGLNCAAPADVFVLTAPPTGPTGRRAFYVLFN
jgi:hypothetical protein